MELALKSEVLSVAREKNNLTSDTQLAELLQVTPVTIRSWRSGKTVPLVRNMARLQELTGIPLGEMIDGF